MHLRQLQKRGITFLRDSELLQVLRSEINHELSSATISSNGNVVGKVVEGFMVEWDEPQTQDVVLRREPDHIFNKEIAISALLAPLKFQDEDPLPRDVLMKVCIQKVGYNPILEFDCRVFHHDANQAPWTIMEANNEDSGTDFIIKRTYYHRPSSLATSGKRNPMKAFGSSLDPQLQNALKEFLVAGGITPRLTNFLLKHLHAKEHSQYVSWLRTMENFIGKAV